MGVWQEGGRRRDDKGKDFINSMNVCESGNFKKLLSANENGLFNFKRIYRL